MLALGLIGWVGIGIGVMMLVILVISISNYPDDNSF
jgi:hypothetical protein